MGKFKKPRIRNRPDPRGKPAKVLPDSRMLPVLKDLQSAELTKRSTAASLIANLIEDPVTRKALLREQIVRVLLEQTLCDSDLETRTVGWGILRNLALEEDASFCVHLYRQDVLTALEGVVKSIILTIESREAPFSSLPKAHRDLTWNLIGSIVNLLSTLSEAKDDIVEAITRIPALLHFPFGVIALDTIPADLEIEVLISLISLSEDNKPLAKHMLDHAFLREGLTQISNSGEAKAVPACAVLHNFFTVMQWYDHNTPIKGCSDAMLIPLLVQSMDTPQSSGNISHLGDSNPPQILQLAVETIASIATCLEEALKHGSRHEEEFKGFGNDGADAKKEMRDGMDPNDDDVDLSDEDNEMDKDDESMHSEEINADMDIVTGDGPNEDENSAEEATFDRLVRIATPKLLQLAITESPIRPYALSALNNVAWTVSNIDFSSSHLESLQNFWGLMGQQIWNEIITPVLGSNTADIELASSVTSLAWAVARSVHGVIEIKSAEHRKIMALYQASRNLEESGESGSAKRYDEPGDAFQGIGVKAIGVLGRLALSPAPAELNREIGLFFLTILSGIPNTAAADVVEALNQLFDIYADKKYAFDEAVFWAGGFHKHLEQILPRAKKLAKGIDKRKFGELRARLDEAVLNLGRFLKYKQTERRGVD